MQTMTTWVIKLSKFCNMRCSYCYEWNELSDRTRMSLALWQRTLEAAVAHSALLEKRNRRARVFDHRNLIVFHGGEPLALPTAYWEQLLEVFERVTQSSKQGGSSVKFALSVQSNLFSIQQEKIDLMRRHGAQLSVSFDVVPGVRLSVAGQPTEQTVSRNIDDLLAQGVRLGAIAVLAKHTVDHVTDIHDFFAERRMGMRILPLFDGPSERNMSSFWIDQATIRRGLERLFRHWIEQGCRIPVHPLGGYFESALRHMAGLYRLPWNRERYGDSIFIVNVDGGLYRVLDAYDQERCLGNLNEQRIDEILASPAYQRSLERDRAEFAAHCDKCEYLGACNGSYLYASRISDAHEGNCPTAHPCISFMSEYVKERGYGPAELRTLLEGIRAGRSAAASAD